jgi:Spy/CpxP family protein refolding chaperone
MLIGFSVCAGGAGLAAGAATAPGSAVPQRLADTRLGKLVMGRIGRGMVLRSELDLTDAQRDAIKQTLQSHKKEIKQAVQPVVEKRRALREAVLADKPDDAAIRKSAIELGSAIGDAGVTLAKIKSEVKTKANLTPEQVKKLNEFRSENDAAIDQLLAEIDKAQ